MRNKNRVPLLYIFGNPWAPYRKLTKKQKLNEFSATVIYLGIENQKHFKYYFTF